MRLFELYVHPSGAYEVLKKGWSFWALFFNLFWAIANGVFVRFLKILLPAFLLMVAGMLLIAMSQAAVIGMVLALVGQFSTLGALVYFSMVATSWRSDLLVSNGYQHVATIEAWTGHQALQKCDIPPCGQVH